MHLNSFNTIISDGSKYKTTFNINTQFYFFVYVCKTHSCSVSTFKNNRQTIIQHSFGHCSIIIMGYFNVDILQDNNQAKNKQELLGFMDKFQLKSQFDESTTKVASQLDIIWANVPRNDYKFSVTKIYWSYFHKLIYIAFKLSNTFSMYNKNH